MPLGNAHHGGDEARPDLATRIEAELRSRIEDAVDFAVLDGMVQARAARGARPPVADDPHDRAEYDGRVRAFLERVRVTIVAGLDEAQRLRLAPRVERVRPADLGAALDAQVALAKELPDYWQRFDAARQAEERHGFPGALRASGGLGGRRGPP